MQPILPESLFIRKRLKDATPGKCITLTVQATGTAPLSYQWKLQCGEGSGEWQFYNVESFPGANSSTLTIPSVQKSNEGSYCCTVSNCAGSETSECANTDCRLVDCCVFIEKQESHAMAIFVLDGGQTCFLRKKEPR